VPVSILKKPGRGKNRPCDGHDLCDKHEYAIDKSPEARYYTLLQQLQPAATAVSV
jgi:hypothetical protein